MILISRNTAKQRLPEKVGGVEGVTFVSDAMGMPVSRRSSRSGNEYTRLRTSPRGSMGNVM